MGYSRSTPMPTLLTINAGSSSIKFALFTAAPDPTRLLTGQIERIGTPSAKLTVTSTKSAQPISHPVPANTFRDAVQAILTFLNDQPSKPEISAIGHRVVHGGMHLLDNQRITPDLIAELRRSQPLDLAHLPREIALIEGFHEAFPSIPQIACFDTAFHRNMPHVAQLLPIPHRYQSAGLRRFGFHGLSYTYLMSELTKLDPNAAKGKVILAHLGSGASMAAVNQSKPIDTTMAFTPTSGLVMGTRPGDLDPGLLVYLMNDQKLSTEQTDKFISRECGLLGVSETSADVRDLLAARATDPRAADAIELFCYSAKKHLAALTAALGGLDTLIFSGGIGEHAPEIRAQICAGLDFLGLHLDPDKNANNAPIISTDQGRVIIRVIPTDEEIVIARTVHSILADANKEVEPQMNADEHR
jgi:acetate kinase